MASMRKKYIEAGPRQDGPPVTTAPTAAAKLPDAVEPKAAEPLAVEDPDPVETAKRDAITLQLRLKEMEHAEQLTRQAQQPPPHAAEPSQQPSQDPLEAFLASLPEPTAKWLRAHPEYITDQRKNAALQHFHWAARDETGEEFTPRYIERLEHHLGLRQQQQRPQPQPQQPQPQPRYEAPVRQQQRSPVPMSAPPSREPASMSTGRPQSFRAPLTADELEIARVSGITPERYAQEKEKMLRMKAAGQLDDRR